MVNWLYFRSSRDGIDQACCSCGKVIGHAEGRDVASHATNPNYPYATIKHLDCPGVVNYDRQGMPFKSEQEFS